MLGSFRSSTKTSVSKVLVWAMLGLLAVGLVGFNLSDMASGLAGRNVARVGGQEITRTEFARTMELATNRFGQSIGQPLTVSQAASLGLGEQVLAQLVTGAALDEQVAALGISVPDASVRDEILSRPEFGGAGGFDPDSYRFALERTGMTVPQFEEQVRGDVARALLEAGVSGGVVVPAAAAEAMLAFEREMRDFSYIQLTAAQTPDAVAPADDATLRQWFDENSDRYRAPETRRVSYAAITTGEMAGAMEIDDAALREAYDAAGSRFRTEERRLIDRIVFGSTEDAAAARRRIDAGDSDFAAEATARGLAPGDIEVGTVRALDLSAAARTAVFSGDQPGIVGPVETEFGPALFRVNAILAARETPFDEAAEALRTELGREAAAVRIDAEIDPVEDLLAGGATLEEIGAETALVFGTVDVFEGSTAPLANDPAFRSRAEAAEPGDLPELFNLANGGLAALRVEEVIPPAAQPFEAVAETVAADWRIQAQQTALAERGRALLARLNEGITLEALATAEGLGVFGETGRTRSDVPDGLTAAVLAEAFAQEPGGVGLVEGGAIVTLVRLDAVSAFDAEADAALLEARQAQLSQGVAFDLLQGFAAGAQTAAGVQINRTVIDQTLALYP